MSKQLVIFIPFSVSEDNFALYMSALNWRSNLKNAQKLEKVPALAIYRHPEETDEDYEDFDNSHFKFSADNIKPDTTLYITAHGMGHDHLVSNTNNQMDKKYVMPIELVAQRVKEMGLTPELARNLNSIKLYMCEENDNNKNLAMNFAHALGKEYSQVVVHFYQKSVSIPMFDAKTGVATKKAVDVLFSNNNQKPQLSSVGKPSDFKGVINVGEALKQKKLPIDDSIQIDTFLTENKASLCLPFQEWDSDRELISSDQWDTKDNHSQSRSSCKIVEINDDIDNNKNMVDHLPNNLSLFNTQNVNKIMVEEYKPTPQKNRQ